MARRFDVDNVHDRKLMSKHHGIVTPIAIEWSPKRVRLFDSGSKSHFEFASLREASSAAGNRPVTVGVSRRNVFIRTVRLPNAAIEDLRPLVQMRLGEMFPVDAADLAYDIMLMDNVTAEGRMVLIAAMPVNDLRELAASIKSSGLKVVRVLPVSLGSVYLSLGTGHETSAVVSEDLTGIGIDIIADRALMSSRVTVGTATLETEVCRTHQMIGLPCGDSIATADIRFPEARYQSSSSPLEALTTVEASNATINLRLPEVVAAERISIRRTSTLRGTMLLLATAGVWIVLLSMYKTKVAAVSKEVSKYSGTTKQLSKTKVAEENKANALAAVQTLIAPSFRPAQRISDILSAVDRNVPDGLWLNGLTLERGKEMQLRGVAKSSGPVSAFTHNLESDGRFRGIHLSFSNSSLIDKTPVQLISVGAIPIGNIPFADVSKKKK